MHQVALNRKLTTVLLCEIVIVWVDMNNNPTKSILKLKASQALDLELTRKKKVDCNLPPSLSPESTCTGPMWMPLIVAQIATDDAQEGSTQRTVSNLE